MRHVIGVHALAIVIFAQGIRAQEPPLPLALQPSQREEVSLDGIWFVQYDPDDALKQEIVAEATFAQVLLPGGPAGPEQIRIPSTVEEHNPGYDGVVWFWRDFVAPASWEGSRVAIEFGAVDYVCELWLNGRRRNRVTNEGGFMPFAEDISDRVRYGEINRVALRVSDLPLDRTQYDPVRGERQLETVPHGMKTTHGSFMGIWQSVTLMRVPPLYFIQASAETSLAREMVSAHYIYHVPSGWAGDVQVQFTVTPWDRPGQVIAQRYQTLEILRTGPYKGGYRFKAPGVRPWSPSEPNLYRLTMALLTPDGVLDQKEVRIGFRDIGRQGRRLTLNGEPLHLRLATYMPGYGRSTAHNQPPEAFRHEIMLAKAAGLNGFLLRATALPPALLSVADETGFLLISEPPTGPMQTSRNAVTHAVGMMTNMLLRDRSHPSILAWSRVGGDHGLDLSMLMDGFCRQLRRLDIKRPIIDNSLLDNEQVSFYPSEATQPLQLHITPAWQPAPDEADLVLVHVAGHAGISNLAGTLRRFGGQEREVYEPENALRRIGEQLMAQHQAGSLWRDHKDLNEWMERSAQVQARLLHARLWDALAMENTTGVIIDTWNDSSWDLRGMVTQFRAEKPAYKAVAQALASPALHVEIDPPVVLVGHPLTLTFHARNEAPASQSGMLHLQVTRTNHDGRVDEVHVAETQVTLATGTKELHHYQLNPAVAGAILSVTAQLRLDDGTRVATQLEIPCAGRSSTQGRPWLLTNQAWADVLREYTWLNPVHANAKDSMLAAFFDDPSRQVSLAGPFVPQGEDHPPLHLLPALYDRVHRGDVAILLGTPFLDRPMHDGWQPSATQAFPIPLLALDSQVPDLSPTLFSRDHPAVASLPPGLLPAPHGPHAWLLPRRLLVAGEPLESRFELPPGDPLVGWFAPARGDSLDWEDVGHGWVGGALMEIPYGEGSFIICELPLLQQATHQPLARQLLADLVAYAQSKAEGPLGPLHPDRVRQRALEEQALEQRE